MIKITYPGSGNNSQFEFDALGRNVKIVEQTGGSTTDTRQFVWCGEKRCEERNSSSVLVARFYSDGQSYSGSNLFYSFDHLSSIREILSSLGVLQYIRGYDPFGRSTRVSEPTDISFGYARYYYHFRSGLNLTLTRPYSSLAGSWFTRDSLPEVVIGPNVYCYVDNNPLLYTAPSGLLAGYLVFGIWVGSQAVFDTTVAVSVGALAGVGIGSQLNPGPFAAHRPAGNPGPVSTNPAKPTSTSGRDPLAAQQIMEAGPVTPVGPKSPCGKCPPCPPDLFWSHPGNAHGSTSGVHYHGIKWNQNPVTCVCYPRRVSGPTPYSMR